MNTIREMAVRGKPLRAIAREPGVARTTVRTHVRWPAEAQPRKRLPSTLDPYYKAQIQQWVTQDHP